MTDDNVIPFPTAEKVEEMPTALSALLMGNTMEDIGFTISGVLEFLTLRALHEGPYFIKTSDNRAITVFACDEDAMKILDLLPDNVKSWDDDNVPPFDTDTDPGDEQSDATKAE